MQKKTQEEFVEQAKTIHSNRYDYSKSIYNGTGKRIKIICPIHGEFFQFAGHHLKGRGCNECSGRYPYKTKEWIEKAKGVHGDTYDYSLAEYTGQTKNLKIKCKIHGLFTQSAGNHLAGKGCYKCGILKTSNFHTLDTESYIKKASEVHDNKYSYPNLKYKGCCERVEIECKKHGSFWQVANNHICGKGCYKCKSSKGELKIGKFLKSLGVDFREQYKIKGCKFKRRLPFDFYIKHNGRDFLIEFQGRQHYESIKDWGGKEALKDVQKRDKIKKDFCENNSIPLLEIRYNDEEWEKTVKEFLNKHEIIAENP